MHAARGRPGSRWAWPPRIAPTPANAAPPRAQRDVSMPWGLPLWRADRSYLNSCICFALSGLATMAPSPTQHTGLRAESLAALWLEEQGLEVLDRNLLCRAGEIDLVARDGETLVFVEVRFRGSSSHGGAAASVNRRKQQRLLRAARYFLPSLTTLH